MSNLRLYLLAVALVVLELSVMAVYQFQVTQINARLDLLQQGSLSHYSSYQQTLNEQRINIGILSRDITDKQIDAMGTKKDLLELARDLQLYRTTEAVIRGGIR